MRNSYCPFTPETGVLIPRGGCLSSLHLLLKFTNMKFLFKSSLKNQSLKILSKIPWFNCFGAALVFCPVLFYFHSIQIYATNIPFSDDYPKQLDQMITIIQSNTLWDKLELIFSKSLENLLFFNKAILLLIYSIMGEINLKVALLFNNLAFLGLLFFTYKTLPKQREKIFLVFPAALLLFQLKQNWIFIMWSVNSGVLYGVLFSGLVFYFLQKSSIKYFLGASFFAICSVVSFGSGIATLAAGWVSLITQKKFKLAWIWLAGMLIYFGLLCFLE